MDMNNVVVLMLLLPKGAIFTRTEVEGQAVLYIGDMQGSASIVVSVTGYSSTSSRSLPSLSLKSLVRHFVLSVTPQLRLIPSQVFSFVTNLLFIIISIF